MAQIDAVADDLAGPVSLALILIYGIFFLLRRKDLVQITSVREGIGNLPLALGLAYVWEGNLFQPGFLLPQQAVFKLLERSQLLRLVFPQQGALAIKIAVAASTPGTFCQGEHIRIEIIFSQQLRCIVYEAVVPEGYDAASQVVAALCLVVDATVKHRHQVGIGIEMVGIVVAAVDGRDALLCLSTIAPELRHVDFARFIVPARVIGDNLLALVADVFHHHRNEIRIGKLNLVGSYMEIRYIECSAYLIDDIFQNLRALLALHIGLEGTLKGSTVARHIDFRNQEHLVLLAEFHQLASLIQGIELTLLTLHVFRCIELRIFPAFQSPSLVFCEMPVEDIDLVSAEETDFTLQFL